MDNIAYWNIYKQIEDIFYSKYIDVTIPHTVTKKYTPIYISKVARTWHPEKIHTWIFQIGENCNFIDASTLQEICDKFDLAFDLYYGKKMNMICFRKKHIDRSALYYYENNPDNENYNPQDDQNVT